MAIMLSLLVQALFALVFGWTLISYLRRRDPLQRDVALMFGSVAAVLALDLARELIGDPPRWVAAVVTSFLLGQPFLTLRLVRRIRSVPGWIYGGALAGWVLSTAAFVTKGERLQVPTLLAIVAVFVLSEVAAAVLLGVETRRRAGAPRVRLGLASLATAMFAGAILVSGAAAADPAHATVAQTVTLALGLASALGFVFAFLPPRWLRRIWSTRAAYTLMRKMLRTPADSDSAATWQGFVEAVREVTGADAAAVLLIPDSDDGPVEVARTGLEASLTAITRPEVEALAAGSQSPLAGRYRDRAGAPFVTPVPLPTYAGHGLLVLIYRHRSLFTDDDHALLAETAAQAAVLAERGDLLAAQRRSAAELADAARVATEASQAKSDFLASMSHELRTPLNAIIGFSDLMRADSDGADTVTVSSEWVGHVHSSGLHLLNLINDILDLAKIEAGRVELSLEPVELVDVVSETVQSLAALSDRKQQEVTVAVPPVRVRADALRLRQILTNLLSNAIKFTPEHGQVFVSARRVGSEVSISVSDTGPGIAHEDQHLVFEEFAQAGDQTGRAAGTGLGLALTRRLVQAHGGRITLESEPDCGSRFTFTMPAAEVTRVAADAAVTAGAEVLIIEDNPAAADLLAAYLRESGFAAIIAGTGEAGLTTARQRMPDAILLDVRLPGIDGWAVLRELKRDETLRHIPVVIISVVEQQEVGIAPAGVDYFVKPISRDALLSWLVQHGLVPPVRGDEVTVLAIDDDPATLALIAGHMRQQGLRVICANGGLDGLRLALEHTFDLVISDLVMPDLDGFTLINALHEDVRTRDVPVLVLTGHDLTEDDKIRLNGKIAGVLPKGDGLADLVHTINEVTGRRTPVSAGT
jgi:signal transduction histidine kinase/DNA-binding response OmpR family regulator